MVVLAAYTPEEVSKHNSKRDAWIIVDGWVLDVTLMSSLHPGGSEILEPYYGKNATDVFRDTNVHYHSTAATHLLKKFIIGYVRDCKSENDIKLESSFKRDASDFGVDLKKGLVTQISGLTAENYEAFVHNVLVMEGPSLKYFDHPMLEFFTRSPWYCVPLVWIPVVVALFYNAVTFGLPKWTIPLFIFTGPFTWNFLEYELHKNLFHMKPNNYFTRLLHFVLHGYHHIYPMDHLRLTFPPIPAAMLGVVIWFSSGLFLLPYYMSFSILGGIISGYIYYDLMHYYLHHAPPKFLLAKELKVHHLYHHYKDESYNYGISMWLFDYLFKTFDPAMLMERQRRKKNEEKIQ